MMLSRVAENLYWIGRYIERAENMARLLDTGRRMAALPGPGGNRNEWESILSSSGSDFCFPEEASVNSRRDVVQHLALSPENPSSIYSSIQMARNNARSTREGLSSDCWRAINDFWLEFKELAKEPVRASTLADLIDRTKHGCMSIVGSFESTVLRNETYDFIRLGTYTERADSTARILDVKYFSLLPDDQVIEGGVDTYQWMTILDATSTRRLFRRLYGTDFRAGTVAELLIQKDVCARSLVFTVMQLHWHLGHLASLYEAELPSEQAAANLLSGLQSRDIEEIIIGGLHEYIGAFIRANNALAHQIGVDFNFFPAQVSTQAQRQTSA